MRLLLNINAAWFLISHRLDVIRAARYAGFEVHVVADVESSEEAAVLEAEGFEFHRVRVKRGGLNPIQDLAYLKQITGVMRKVRPDVVHNVTVKPVIYGSVAARLCGIGRIVNAVSGLGYAFSGEESRRILSFLVKGAYRFALRGPDLRVIFQNSDDLKTFLDAGIIDRAQAVLIRGSGVDLRVFEFSEEPLGNPVILFPARMLRDKGVIEFVEAACLLRARGHVAKFVLAGKVDAGNPSSLNREDLARFEREAGVEWLGHVTDMPSLYRRAHIVCLPSYREGLPKALLEACATGRAIVATDVPGCREAVRNGENGLLVQPRNSVALADALEVLLADQTLRQRMGAAGRKRAEEEFDVRSVVRATLDVYNSVMS